MSVDTDMVVRSMAGPALGDVIPNVATLLERNALQYGRTVVFQQKREGKFAGPTWAEFVERIRRIAWSLRDIGFRPGERCAIVSPNRLEMLEFELAIMATGGVAVPIFAWYPPRILSELVSFCRPSAIVAGGPEQLARLDSNQPARYVIALDDIEDVRFPDLLHYSDLIAAAPTLVPSLSIGVEPHKVCLMQYTSGTSGKPKCVQLTHRNILSQQVALQDIWPFDGGDRLLSYLPWHHSFGGIFELFNALGRGATIWLEPTYGKDVESIIEHWMLVRPTAFFSVPKVYQALVDHTREFPETLDAIFHPGLSFVFTAAAPLPQHIAREFDSRGVRIIEGWGLTETAPCCTIAGANGRREAGYVGHPIGGVSLRIAPDGEIQVTGPNVMRGYFDNAEENAEAFTEDGWFRTGDIGALSERGLRLIGRRDRIFKLSNGEKVVSTEVEQALQGACHYLSFAVVEGSGQSYPVALLFPNRSLLGTCASSNGCTCPKNLEELSTCLATCLSAANQEIDQKFARIPFAILIDGDLSIEHGTLTPSMKVVARNVADLYRATIEDLYSDGRASSNDVYVIPLQTGRHESFQPQ